MNFTKLELTILRELATKPFSISELSKILRKSHSQIYRNVKSLEKKMFVSKNDKFYQPSRNIHTYLLITELLEHPNLANVLSGPSIDILTASLTQIEISKLCEEINITKSTAYSHIKKLQNVSILKKENGTIVFNSKLWPQLEKFIKEYTLLWNSIDLNLPVSATIYERKKNEIIFSTHKPYEATQTGFSAFSQQGLSVFSPKYYYRLPRKKLNLIEIFEDSLKIGEKEDEYRHKLFIGLYYLKYKEKLGKIKHPIIEQLSQVLQKQRVPNFPSYDELKEKAQEYGVKIDQ
jgi:predicted transcriptional regulator